MYTKSGRSHPTRFTSVWTKCPNVVMLSEKGELYE